MNYFYLVITITLYGIMQMTPRGRPDRVVCSDSCDFYIFLFSNRPQGAPLKIFCV